MIDNIVQNKAKQQENSSLHVSASAFSMVRIGWNM
jgi:hypothetical protein